MTVLAVVAYLTVHGCSPAGAAGIAANLEAESRLVPTAASGSGLGLAQWAGLRRQRMLSALGHSWTKPAAQLGYLLGELGTLGYYDAVCRSAVPEAASRHVTVRYERPRCPFCSAPPRARRAREIYEAWGRR